MRWITKILDEIEEEGIGALGGWFGPVVVFALLLGAVVVKLLGII